MVARVGPSAKEAVFTDDEYVFVDPETFPTVAELAQQESDRRTNNIAKTILVPVAFFVLGPAQSLTRLITGAVVTAVLSEAINARFPVIPKT